MDVMVLDLTEVRRDAIGMALAFARGDAPGAGALYRPYERDAIRRAALIGALCGALWGLAVELGRISERDPRGLLVELSLREAAR